MYLHEVPDTILQVNILINYPELSVLPSLRLRDNKWTSPRTVLED